MDENVGITRKTVAQIAYNGFEEALRTMAGVSPDRIENVTKVFSIMGAMIFGGSTNTLLTISTDNYSAKSLVSYMTGIDISDVKDVELFDVVAELVNMSAGFAKSRLAETENAFKLTSPFTITGDNLSLITKKNVESYKFAVGINDIEIGLEIFYF